MQQIVNVTIDESGRSIADSKSIGLQYETGVAQFVIAPDPSWVSDQYFYYLIVSPPEDSEKKQYAVPLVNQGGTFVFKISSGITWTVGNYKFAFIAMSKELTDGRVPSDGIVSISTAWNCKIEKSILDYVSLQSQPADANFQLLYTDLMALSVELKNVINNIELEGNYAREQGDEAKKQAEYAKEQGDYAKEKGDYANTKAELANTKAEYANTQGNYAKTQGEQAQTKGNKAQEQGNTAEQQAQYATEQGNYAKRVGDTVQGQIDRLRANQVQGTANGTELVVQDSANIESILHLNGNSEQDSRSGKNIAQINETNFNLVDNGIENLWSGDGRILTTINIKAGQTITVKYKQLTAVVADTSFTGYVDGAVQDRLSFTGVHKYTIGNIITKTYTATEDCTITWKIWGNANGEDFTFQFWATVDNDTLEDYEAYGVQPSPENESPIRSVKGKSDNLYDGNISTFYPSVNGAVAITSGLSRSVILRVNGVETYTISKPASSILRIAEYNSDTLTEGKPGTLLYESANTKITTQATVTTSSNAKTLLIFVLNTTYDSADETALANNIIKMQNGIMVNKGTVALPYQPYGYAPVEVKVEGKNLYDYKDVIMKDSNITVDDDGWITATFDNTNGTTTRYMPYYTNNLELKENTYYNVIAEIKNVSGNGHFRPCSEYNGAGQFETFFKAIFSDLSNNTIIRQNVKTFSDLSGVTNGLRTEVSFSQGQSGSITFRLSVLEDTTVTADTFIYEPFKLTTVSLPLGDIELRSTPDGTRDTFERVDGVWNKRNKSNKIVLNGSEEIGKVEGNNGVWLHCVSVPNCERVSTGYILPDLMCDKFLPQTRNDLFNGNADGVGLGAQTTDYYKDIIIRAEALDNLSAEEFKTHLSNNPLTVQYPLATPTYNPITDTALISALDELEELILHKGYNRITATAVNGVKAYLDLSYIKDINTVLNNMSAMLMAIGGDLNV